MLWSDGGHQHWRPSGLQHPGEMGSQMSSGEKNYLRENKNKNLILSDLLRTLNFPLLMNLHFRPESSMMTSWRKCRAGEGRDLSLRVTVVSSRTAHSSGENIRAIESGGGWFAVNIIKNNIGGSIPTSLFVKLQASLESQQKLLFLFEKFHGITWELNPLQYFVFCLNSNLKLPCARTLNNWNHQKPS